MSDVLTMADVAPDDVRALLARYGLELVVQKPGESIDGSFWGDSEAGIIGNRVYVRVDTPVHSLLHETCHVVCMDADRRDGLHQDAGGDDLEECGVCYLQILLADHLPKVGRNRLMQDMDSWGYSFRLGSAARWFAEDAEDAAAWLAGHELIDEQGRPSFTLRT